MPGSIFQPLTSLGLADRWDRSLSAATTEPTSALKAKTIWPESQSDGWRVDLPSLATSAPRTATEVRPSLPLRTDSQPELFRFGISPTEILLRPSVPESASNPASAWPAPIVAPPMSQPPVDGARTAEQQGTGNPTPLSAALARPAIDDSKLDNAESDPASASRFANNPTAVVLSIGNRVWLDSNANGAQEIGERGLGGIAVQLLQGSIVVATTVTSENGNYAFTGEQNIVTGAAVGPVFAGQTYTVRVQAPSWGTFTQAYATIPSFDSNVRGSTPGGQQPGQSGNISVTTTNPTNTTIDIGITVIGFQPGPNIPNPTTLGDKVWVDLNGDGLQTGNEPGLDSVTVTLHEANGTQVGQDVTANAGTWKILALNWDANKDYYLKFTPPAGFAFTTPLAGTNPARDSNAQADGKTALFRLPVGTTNPTFDAGVVRTYTEVAANTIVGPAVVPGNSRYTYTAVLNGDVTNTQGWSIVPQGGLAVNNIVSFGNTLKTYDPISNKTISSIELTFQNNTPVKIDLSATINGQPIATKTITVVQVIVTAPSGRAAFIPGTSGTLQGAANNGVVTFLNSSGSTNNLQAPPSQRAGLNWAAGIELYGPNGNEGVDQIKVGFIQYVNPVNEEARYTATIANNPVNKWRVSPMKNAGPFLDKLDPGLDPINPWYAQSAVYRQVLPGQPGAGSIDIYDTPQYVFPATWQGLTAAEILQAPNITVLSRIQMRYEFQLNVAAQTLDTSNYANHSFWSIAMGNWTWNGNGDVQSSIQAQQLTLTWLKDNGGGVIPPQSWAQVPAPIMLMSGTIPANEASVPFDQWRIADAP